MRGYLIKRMKKKTYFKINVSNIYSIIMNFQNLANITYKPYYLNYPTFIN